MVESILIVLFVLLLFAAAVMIFRATMYGKLPDPVEPAENAPVDTRLVAEHLSAAVRIQTISGGDRSKIDYSTFDSLRLALERMYPRLHSTLKREIINDHSLLFTWPGRAAELEPVALLAHMDVVPADPTTLQEWTHPPFSGALADGFVWGRGTLDMKSIGIAQMEAVETLIKAGYQPERTIYLAFGHDEEIGGWNGARCIVEALETRGVRLASVLDEGGAVMTDSVPGVSLPVAMVGVAEKGHVSMELKVEGRPGHSSVPPKHTAIGILARALTRIESSPMPARLSMVRLMFEPLGAFLPMRMRLALANQWLFGGAVRKQLESAPQTNAMVRTTMAATVISGGVKDNIIPAQARAVVNSRLLPGDSIEKVLEYARKVVNDEAVQINAPEESCWEPSPVSPVDSPVYRGLSNVIREVFPDTLVAPYLVSGATDSRHYARIAGSVYRFSPYVLNADLLKTMHGIDERIPVDVLEAMVQFYTHLIKSWTSVVGEGR